MTIAVVSDIPKAYPGPPKRNIAYRRVSGPVA